MKSAFRSTIRSRQHRILFTYVTYVDLNTGNLKDKILKSKLFIKEI